MIGAVVLGSGYVVAAFLMHTPWELLIASCIASAGVGIGYAAMPTLIMDSVPMREAGSAVGINGLMRSIGTTVASAVMAMLLTGSTEDLARRSAADRGRLPAVLRRRRRGGVRGCRHRRVHPARAGQGTGWRSERPTSCPASRAGRRGRAGLTSALPGQQPDRAGSHQGQRVEVGLARGSAPSAGTPAGSSGSTRVAGCRSRLPSRPVADPHARAHRLVRRAHAAVVHHHDPAAGEAGGEGDRARERRVHRLPDVTAAGRPRGGRNPTGWPAGRTRPPPRAAAAAARRRAAREQGRDRRPPGAAIESGSRTRTRSREQAHPVRMRARAGPGSGRPRGLWTGAGRGVPVHARWPGPDRFDIPPAPT